MRTMFSRRARTAAAGAVLACAALTVTACGSAASSSAAGSTAVVAARTAAKVYLADGQDINGTAVYKPACRSLCVLSGDSTAFISKMTWTTWSATKAVGTGLYVLNNCTPDCASGHLYRVPAVATFSHPVKACSQGKTRWFWSRVSFTFPKGLPKALRGDNAPRNPWIFSALINEAQLSCRG